MTDAVGGLGTNVGNDSYYGFPSHYYKVKYPNVGSKDVAEKVLRSLKDAGIEAEGVKRGLDHGVFASFMCGKKIALGRFSVWNRQG